MHAAAAALRQTSPAAAAVNTDAWFNQLGKLDGIAPLNPLRKTDFRTYGIGAQILHDLDITKIKLLTNSWQNKRVGMIGYGLEITEYLNY